MKKDPRLEVHTSDLGCSFGVRDGSKSMIAGMNKSGKYGAELKFSVKSMDVMKVMVKSDSKSSNDALTGLYNRYGIRDYMKRLYEKSNQISNVIDILRTGGYNMRYLWVRCLRYVDASMCVLKAK